MSLEKLIFEANVPHEIALRYTEGKITQGRFGDSVFYTLMTPPNHCMYLDLGVAEKLNQLDPRKGEPLMICKRIIGKSVKWDVYRPGQGETRPSQASQATGIPDTDLEQQLRDTLAQIERKKQAEASVSAPAPVATAATQPPYNNGHVNTNGNANGNGANARPYEASGIPAPAVKIPYDVAFRELLGVVVEGLKAAGEQWSDGAKQDAVSTLLIQAARDGFLCCWQRGAK